MRGNLKDNQAKLDSYEKSIKAVQERRRKVIMESKQITYDMLSELYGLEGQELVETATIGFILSHIARQVNHTALSRIKKRHELLTYYRFCVIISVRGH